MISIDTNILLHAENSDSPEHSRALEFVCRCGRREDVAICELVLVELYLLLRNPAVVAAPLDAPEAAEVCQTYRSNPRWRLVENAPVMAPLWEAAASPGFPRRRVFDLRLALTLLHHGVTEFATAHARDFEAVGFARVWNPLV